MPVWGGGRPPASLDIWKRDLAELNAHLVQGEIGAMDWQSRVEALNRLVPMEELVRYIEVEQLTRHFQFLSLYPEVADNVLPTITLATGGQRRWFVRLFGFARGGAIIPHIHNHAASAHLVVSGMFHIRTHDRVEDLRDAVVLRTSLDRHIKI
jgi:hypothetical protein